MYEFSCPRKLLPLINKKKRFKIVVGGRGGSKSRTGGYINLKDAQVKGLKIGYFREFQNSIDDSVKSVLDKGIKDLVLEGFNSTTTEITTSSGGKFKFKGLARNPSSIQSMEGFDRFVVEECQTLSEESIKILTPTLREDDSEIWMFGNPQSAADPFSQRFLAPFQQYIDRDGYYEDDDHLIIVINYYDNPFFPEVLEKERQFDKEFLSVAEYEHKWLGAYNDTVEGAIIPVAWFNAAIDAHIKLGFKQIGATIVTFDPADETKAGKNDPKGLVARQGPVVFDVQEHIKGDVNVGTDWATYWALEYKADVFRWDCDGLGAGLKRQVSTTLDGKGIDVEMFKGSESVDNPNEIYQPDNLIDRSNAKTNEQTFRNKRAQYYWYLRDRFFNTYLAVTRNEYRDPETLISISSEIDIIDRLRSEVCRIPKKKTASGLIQIMSKDEMERLKPPIKSPNLADSLMMNMKGHTRNLAFQATARAVVQKSSGGWT